MLPKEEKIKKKPDSDQPSLFDKENERKRLLKKRRFLYVTMFLTIGLSLSFWTYRSLKNFNFSFKLPQFNFSLSSPKINQPNLSFDSRSTWSVFLQQINSNTVVYQKNSDLLFVNQDQNSLLDKIDQTNFVTSSPYTSALPEGIKVKELIEETDSTFSYFSKIITPSQELFLIIGISNSSDLTSAKKSLPNLINQLYWYSLQK